MHFTKLFNSILDSTIWQESKDTKLVWITMLAMCDKNGEIHASIPGLAVRSGVSISECEDALTCLLSPDKYSRTKDEEGRRIVDIDGGWRLINHPKYRALLSTEERREYMAQKQREHRAKVASTNVKRCGDKSTKSTHTEAEAEAEADIKKEKEGFEKSNHWESPEFQEVAAAYQRARTAKHLPAGIEVVEAWAYDLQRFDTDEAIAILRYSTACNAKTPITNGDHKRTNELRSPGSNGRPKPQTNQEKLRAILKEQLGT